MNSQEGFIKLFRSFTSWDLYKSLNVKVVFIHLLLIANYQDDEKIMRGQCKITLRGLAECLGLSVQNIRTALSTLTQAHVITQLSTPRYIVVIISNYENYQVNIKDKKLNNQHEVQHNSQHNGQERTSPHPLRKNIKKPLKKR